MNITEWHKWRRRGIGGSDAPILYGLSEYMTPLELFKQKRSKTIKIEPDTYAQRRGREIEPIARNLFSAEYNLENMTNEIFEPKLVENNFFRASLDGCSKNGDIIIEIKHLSEPIKNKDKLTEGQKKHLAVLEGVIPKAYVPQIQHNLMVSNARVCWFISYDGETLHKTIVQRDEIFIQKHIEICADFWARVKNNLPPEMSEKDELLIKDKRAIKFVKLYKKQKAIEKELDDIKESIIKEAKHINLNISNRFKLVRQSRQGSIDINKISKEFNIDLEKYRKNSIKSWKIILEREKND